MISVQMGDDFSSDLLECSEHLDQLATRNLKRKKAGKINYSTSISSHHVQVVSIPRDCFDKRIAGNVCSLSFFCKAPCILTSADSILGTRYNYVVVNLQTCCHVQTRTL